MSKRIWLLFFVFAGLFWMPEINASSNAIDKNIKGKISQKAENDNEGEEQEKIEVGQPYDLEQCNAPEGIIKGARFNLLDALRGPFLNATWKDAENKEIVPFGFKYKFYEAEGDANNDSNSRTPLFDLDSESIEKTFWVRIYPVNDPNNAQIRSFTVRRKVDNCTISDMIVSMPDLYKKDSGNGTAVFQIKSNINDAFYGAVVNYTVQAYKVVNGVRGAEIPQNEWDSYLGKNKEQIEVVVTKAGSTDPKDKGAKRFTLYTEKLELNDNLEIESPQVKVNDGKRIGLFNLIKTLPNLTKDGKPEYYDIAYYSDATFKDDKRIPDDQLTQYEAADSTKVYAKVVSKLFYANKDNGRVTITLKVTDKPYIKPLDNLTECNTKLPEYKFDLLLRYKDVLGNYPEAKEGDEVGYTVGYFAKEEDAEKNENPIPTSLSVKLNESVKVWVRLTDIESGNYNVSYFFVSLGYDDLKAKGGQDFNRCLSSDQKTYNLYNIERSLMNYDNGNPILSALTVNFYRTKEDAFNDTDGSLAIPRAEAEKYEVKKGVDNTVELWARVRMKGEGFNCMSAPVSFTIKFNLMPNATIEKVTSLQLCRDYNTGEVSPVILRAVLNDEGPYTIRWFKLVPTGNEGLFIREYYRDFDDKIEFPITEVGRFGGEVTYKNNPYEGVDTCAVTDNWLIYDVEVVVYNTDSTGMINSLDIDESGEAVVEFGIKDSGNANFEFSIDNGAFQASNRFYNVPLGDHIAWVRNKETGCLAYTTFSVFGYPKFFTPNGDGFNDTWNVPGLAGHPEARINIFDRYGKLIKQLSPRGEGWDGTFNGRNMPSTDYWFTIEFTNDYRGNKELDGRKVTYKGHFSLKR